MTPSASARSATLTLAAVLLLGTSAFAAGPPPRPGPLEGVWLFESALNRGDSQADRLWETKFRIVGDKFVLPKYMGLWMDVKGTFTLDPTTSPKRIDLAVEACNLFWAGVPFKIPACKLPGIYELEGDRLKVVFPIESDAARPAGFDAAGDRLIRCTLVKVPVGFKAFPDKVKIKVIGVDGRPAAGVTIARGMYSDSNPDRTVRDRTWTYSHSLVTGGDGTATVKYTEMDHGIVVRDLKRKQMAIVALSPAGLVTGEVSVILKPECRVKGSVLCEEMRKLGKHELWTNVYCMKDGRRVGGFDSLDGKMEFLLPPGKYTLEAYGNNVGHENVPITVPEGKPELTLDPILLPVAKLVLLEGRPAPALKEVVAWKGRKVKLSDLKGKYVLLEFWGYWCYPCLQTMPVMIELHEKFHDKGLVVVGIHLDPVGDVDTAAKLDEKLAGVRKDLWGGKDLPFPVALLQAKSGTRKGGKAAAGLIEAYGISMYPTTVLIDPEGKVVGTFGARDAKAAVKKVEELLGKKK